MGFKRAGLEKMEFSCQKIHYIYGFQVTTLVSHHGVCKHIMGFEHCDVCLRRRILEEQDDVYLDATWIVLFLVHNYEEN